MTTAHYEFSTTGFEIISTSSIGLGNSRTVYCPFPTGANSNSSTSSIAASYVNVSRACDTFSKAGTASLVLFSVALAMSCFACFLFIRCLVPLFEKNTKMVVTVTILLFLPLIFSVTGIFIYTEVAVPAATEFASAVESVLYPTTQGSNVVSNINSFKVGGAFGVLIAGACLQVLVVIVSAVRSMMYASGNKELKELVEKESKSRAPDSCDTLGVVPVMPTIGHSSNSNNNVPNHRIRVEERLDHRLVNDDWQRQLAILEQRKIVVIEYLRNHLAEGGNPNNNHRREGNGSRSEASSSSNDPAVPNVELQAVPLHEHLTGEAKPTGHQGPISPAI